MVSLFSCTIVSLIQIGTVVFAALAALFWGRAAMVKVPSGVSMNDLTLVVGALRRQNRLNSFAAGCAAIALILQGILVYSPNCIKLT